MRLAVAMLAVALAGVLLGACGGGSTRSSSGETHIAAGSTSQTQTAAANAGAQTAGPQPAGTGSEHQGASPNATGKREAPPAANGSQREAGGEKSIEDFGSEAQGSPRQAMLTVERDYLNALAAGDFTQACSLLSSVVQHSLERLAGSHQGSEGCAAILPKLLSPSAPGVAREQAHGQITRVRVKGSRAFIVFHAPGAKLYMFTLIRESRAWRLTTVASSVLVPAL